MNAQRAELIRAVSALAEIAGPGKRLEAIRLGREVVEAAAAIERAAIAEISRRVINKIRIGIDIDAGGKSNEGRR